MPLVTLRSYRDPIEADVARAHLEDAGIPSVVFDDHLITAQWLYSVAIGGAKLKVDAADVMRANEILGEDRSAELAEIPESRNPASDGERCPTCGSQDVAPSAVRRNLAALALVLDFPIGVGRRRWRCQACGTDWRRRTGSPGETPRETLEAEQVVHQRSGPPVLVIVGLVAIGVLILNNWSSSNPPPCAGSVSECDERERR